MLVDLKKKNQYNSPSRMNVHTMFQPIHSILRLQLKKLCDFQNSYCDCYKNVCVLCCRLYVLFLDIIWSDFSKSVFQFKVISGNILLYLIIACLTDPVHILVTALNILQKHATIFSLCSLRSKALIRKGKVVEEKREFKEIYALDLQSPVFSMKPACSYDSCWATPVTGERCYFYH